MRNVKKFWFRWMMHYSLGELLGIGGAAIVTRLLFYDYSNVTYNRSSAVTVLVLLIAGTMEGLIIGYIQWRSLSKFVVDLKPSHWIGVTMLAAMVGWVIILPPSVIIIFFFAKISVINMYYSVAYIILAGFAFGGLIGIPQYFIIRKFYRNAMVWIFANAIGWALSFFIFYCALSLFTEPIFNLVLILSACILSGGTQGVITGTSLHFAMTIKKEHLRKTAESTLF